MHTPTLSAAPPPAQASLAHPLLRCGKRHGWTIDVIALGDPAGASLHFAGKSTPCTEPRVPCPLCRRGQRPRWCGYLWGWHIRQQRIVCCEFTPAAEPALSAWRAKHGTLRGARVQLSRDGRRANARLVAKVAHVDLVEPPPAAPDLAEYLSRLWRYDAVLEAACAANAETAAEGGA